MSALPEALTVASLALLAAITPDQEVAIYGSGAVGVLLGGKLGAELFPFDTKAKKNLAWAVNIFAGIICTPLATYWLHEKFPDAPIQSLGLACGGLCGMSAVSLIMCLFPSVRTALKDWLLSALGTLAARVLINKKDLYPPEKKE